MVRARFLHISDIHLGAFPEDPVRRQDVATAFERGLSLAFNDDGTPGVDFVVIAGDLFDKKTISPDVLTLHARPPLERLRRAGIPVFAIEGNHDEPVHGARHSWVSYLGTERLVLPLRPVLHPELSFPELVFPQDVSEGAAPRATVARVVAPGKIDVIGLGYLGPRTESVLAELPRVIPDLGDLDRRGPAVVLLHAMPSPTGLSEPGTFTEASLEPLSGRHVYLALGHGHKRWVHPDAAREHPVAFVAASPGSLEYIHETDFHRDDARGAIIVTVEDDGRFSVEMRDTLKRARLLVRVNLSGLEAPSGLADRAEQSARDQGLAEQPGAIVAVLLEGDPAFSRTQLPLGALERRLREVFRPVSLEVRFQEGADDATAPDGTSEPILDLEADVASTLGQLFKERLPASVRLDQIDRLARFVATRIGEGGSWRESREGKIDEQSGDLADTLSCLVDLVAGPDAPWVLEAALDAQAASAAAAIPPSAPAPANAPSVTASSVTAPSVSGGA